MANMTLDQIMDQMTAMQNAVAALAAQMNGATTPASDAVKATADEMASDSKDDGVESTVRVTVQTPGGYGITATDGALYSVGPKHRETYGKLFAEFKAGDVLDIDLVKRGSKFRAVAARIAGSAPATTEIHLASLPAPVTVKAPATAPKAPATAPKAPATAPKAPAAPVTVTGGDCSKCGRKHNHDVGTSLLCSIRQYARETGGSSQNIFKADPASVLAYAQWLNGAVAAAPATAPKAPAAPATAPKAPAAPATAPKAPAAPATAPKAGNLARPRCLACKLFVKAGESYHGKCKPAADPAVIAAMSAETVHIDSLDDDAPAIPEIVKTAADMSQADLNKLTGVFDVTIDGLPKALEAAIKTGNAETIAEAVANVKTIARFKSADFVTRDGRGRWLKVTREMLATLAKRPAGFEVRIALAENCTVTKIGRKASETAVETNPAAQLPTNGKPANRANARKQAQAARVSQTVVEVGRPTDVCPNCDRRFSVAGMGQRGMCAKCAPKPAAGKNGRKAS